RNYGARRVLGCWGVRCWDWCRVLAAGATLATRGGSPLGRAALPMPLGRAALPMPLGRAALRVLLAGGRSDPGGEEREPLEATTPRGSTGEAWPGDREEGHPEPFGSTPTGRRG